MNVAKGDVVDASGSLHLCAGQTSGSEAVYIGMHTMFEVDDTDAVLLIDSSNALNTLNRATAVLKVTMGQPAKKNKKQRAKRDHDEWG